MEMKHASRLASDRLHADERAAQALKSLPTYASPNPQLSREAVQETLDVLQAKRNQVQTLQQALNVASTNLIETEWQLHATMQGVKSQAVAQFGVNSSEIEALGLKRKIDRKKPSRKQS